jgi:hypothetical protein
MQPSQSAGKQRLIPEPVNNVIDGVRCLLLPSDSSPPSLSAP